MGYTVVFLGANWTLSRVQYRMPLLGKPREILSPGRTQPEVKKYLHLLLLGGQPGPSLLSLACQEGLQEKMGLLQQPREGQGPVGVIQRRTILFALLHCHWNKTPDTSSGFYAWVVSGGSARLWGAPRAEQELHIAPCVLCICFIFASRPRCLQKHLQRGKDPKDRLSHHSRCGLAQQQDRTQLPQLHPCKISSTRLSQRWKFLEILLGENAGQCFSGIATLPMPQLVMLLPLSEKRMA